MVGFWPNVWIFCNGETFYLLILSLKTYFLYSFLFVYKSFEWGVFWYCVELVHQKVFSPLLSIAIFLSIFVCEMTGRLEGWGSEIDKEIWLAVLFCKVCLKGQPHFVLRFPQKKKNKNTLFFIFIFFFFATFNILVSSSFVGFHVWFLLFRNISFFFLRSFNFSFYLFIPFFIRSYFLTSFIYFRSLFLFCYFLFYLISFFFIWLIFLSSQLFFLLLLTSFLCFFVTFALSLTFIVAFSFFH